MVEYLPAVKRPQAPLCSVCIANYNGARLLEACIGSVHGQHGDIPVEIIVHDDASTDDSIAVLRERFPDVEVLASHDNVGFCIANNRMVQHARGHFVLLLNNDAALFPDALEALVLAARAPDGDAVLTLPQYDWETGELVDRGCLLDPFYNPVPNLDPQRAAVAMTIGACLFAPRSLWQRVGGLPEWMESIAEDLYFCCRARLLGARVSALPDSGYRHRQGASFGGNRVRGGKLATTFRRRRLSERNKLCTMIVCSPWPVLAFVLPVHAIALSLEGTALALMSRQPAVWTDIYAAALRSAWQMRHELRQRRREVQSTRRIGLFAYLRAFTWRPRKLVLLFRYGLPRVRR